MKKNKTTNIYVNLQDDDCIYSTSALDDAEFLDSGLKDNIVSLSNSTSLKNKLNFLIRPSKSVPLNNKQFQEAFQNTFKNSIQEKNHEIYRCVCTGLTIFFVGIVLMLITLFVSPNVGEVFQYITDLFTWICVWDSVEVLTVELIQLIIDKKKYQKILSSKLIFNEVKKTKIIK